jgi:N-methylhydantoinase A/oxoprolinase/acetone carboxylase beta subunit
VSTSAEILPEHREYERFSTAVANAYVSPIIGQYLQKLTECFPRTDISVMLSNGGITPAAAAAKRGVDTILSGPAAGVLGAQKIAREAGFHKIITLDMGGTSTDVSLCRGNLQYTSETVVGGIPIRVPMVDIESIGAGGGSIARVDDAGALRVGPKSAGADPGPACYGIGTDATVTDADLLIGRMDPESFLGGRKSILPDASRQALRKLAEAMRTGPVDAAAGIVSVIEQSMESALRVVSVSRGEDPSEYALVSFGGAAGMHASQLAKSLKIGLVVIPPSPGLLSAWGMLVSDRTAYRTKSVLLVDPGTARLRKETQALEAELRRELQRGRSRRERVRFAASLDMRYKGQAYEIEIPFTSDFVSVFHQTHEKLFGYHDAGRSVQVVNVRLRGEQSGDQLRRRRMKPGTASPVDAFWKSGRFFHEGKHGTLKVYRREELRPGNRMRGPALVCEDNATCFLPPRGKATVDGYSNILLEPAP